MNVLPNCSDNVSRSVNSIFSTQSNNSNFDNFQCVESVSPVSLAKLTVTKSERTVSADLKRKLLTKNRHSSIESSIRYCFDGGNESKFVCASIYYPSLDDGNDCVKQVSHWNLIDCF